MCHGREEKRWLGLAADPPAPPRVSALVILRPADGAATLCPVAPPDAARLVDAHMVSFNPSDLALMARSWRAVGRLVEEVPAYSFSYERRYEGLADAASSLLARLRDGTPATT